jgi:membrane carboxypeptidase/penicillin-binding protein
MKRAVTLPRYRNTQPFERPEGVVFETIDPETQQLATPDCPVLRSEVFIAGTEPTETCQLHSGHSLEDLPPVSWLSRVLGGNGDKAENPAGEGKEDHKEEKKKRGFFKRLFGIGKDKAEVK